MQLAAEKRPPGANATNFNTPICTLKPLSAVTTPHHSHQVFFSGIFRTPAPAPAPAHFPAPNEALLTHKMRIKHTQLGSSKLLPAWPNPKDLVTPQEAVTSCAIFAYEPLERLTSCTPIQPTNHPHIYPTNQTHTHPHGIHTPVATFAPQLVTSMAFSSIKHGVKRHGLRAQKGELLSSNTAATARHPGNLMVALAQQTDPRTPNYVARDARTLKPPNQNPVQPKRNSGPKLPADRTPCITSHHFRCLLALPLEANTERNYCLITNLIEGYYTNYWSRQLLKRNWFYFLMHTKDVSIYLLNDFS